MPRKPATPKPKPLPRSGPGTWLRPKLYQIREDYFKDIDTSLKAYFLGLIFADGNVHGGMFSIGQEEGSKDVLDKLASEISIDGLKKVKCSLGRPRVTEGREYTCKPLCVLQVCRKAMVQDLISHGCVPRKTKVLRFPYASIQPSMYRDFLRGYIDGDGSISCSAKSLWRIDVCTKNREFAQDLLDISKGLGLDFSCRFSKVYVLEMGSHKNIHDLYHAIYYPGCFAMDRKRKQFERFLVDYEKRLSREDYKSPYKYVTIHRNRFGAATQVKGARYNLGEFDDAEVASMSAQWFREFMGLKYAY